MITTKSFLICHSEERSDEESFLYRYCEDPSLSLRMTWKETLIRYQIPSLVILILTVTGFFDSLNCRKTDVLRQLSFSLCSSLRAAAGRDAEALADGFQLGQLCLG